MLAIEKEAWLNLPQHATICRFCDSQIVETEGHIALQCPRYAHIGENYRTITSTVHLLADIVSVNASTVNQASDLHHHACAWKKVSAKRRSESIVAMRSKLGVFISHAEQQVQVLKTLDVSRDGSVLWHFVHAHAPAIMIPDEDRRGWRDPSTDN